MCPLMFDSLLSCVVISDVSDELDGAEFKGDMSRNEKLVVIREEKTTCQCNWAQLGGIMYIYQIPSAHRHYAFVSASDQISSIFPLLCYVQK